MQERYGVPHACCRAPPSDLRTPSVDAGRGGFVLSGVQPAYRRFPATFLLCGTLVGTFGLQLLFGASDGDALAYMGATTPTFWEDRAWWTLCSATLLHFGPLHLLANLYFTWMIGRALEVGLGGARMLLVFFVGGLTGNLASVTFLPDALSAGASGGAWGLLLSILVLLLFAPLREGTLIRGGPVGPVLRLVGLNALISFVPGVNGLAHFGGGLGGALAIVLSRYVRLPWGLVAGALWVLHVGSLGYAVLDGHPWDPVGPLQPTELLDGRVRLLAPEVGWTEAGDLAQTTEPARHGFGGRVDWIGETVDPASVFAELERSAGGPVEVLPCPDTCRAGRVEVSGVSHSFAVHALESSTVMVSWTLRPELDDTWVAESLASVEVSGVP